MKIYADSSYLLQFLTPDFASSEAISLHRKLDRPAYAFVPLHELEVPNALRLRLFAAAGLASAARRLERKAVADGFRRLRQNLEAGRFRNTPLDRDATDSRARLLSERFTCDRAQAVLARAAGLKTTLVG